MSLRIAHRSQVHDRDQGSRGALHAVRDADYNRPAHRGGRTIDRGIEMYKSICVVLLCLVASSSSLSLLVRASTIDDARSLWEISCMIRKDKFDYVLPTAMRRNRIDMWIVLDRGRGTEPMARDFGIDTVNGQGIYIFFDPGEGRVERIQLGPETDMAEDCGAYDSFGRSTELRSIVEERDPKTIALNFLAVPNTREGIHVADGLSHTDYQFLENELGESTPPASPRHSISSRTITGSASRVRSSSSPRLEISP